VLGILREGEILFDLRTIDESDIEYVAEAIAECVTGLRTAQAAASS
jgi:hypothetical protein